MNVVDSCCELSAVNSELKMALSELGAKYKELNLFHSAILKINQLSDQCTDINQFYQQIHSIINTLMNADNFYIVQFFPSDDTLEFVYLVDEKEAKPAGRIALANFEGSLTAHVIKTKQPLLVTPQTLAQMEKDLLVKPVGAIGVDWLGIPLIREGSAIGLIAVQSYDETTRYNDRDKELLQFAAQHIVVALRVLQSQEELQQAVDIQTLELKQQIRERENSELLQESLLHISELSSKNLSVETFYDQVRNIIGQLLSCSNFYVAKFDQQEQLIEFVYYVDQMLDDRDIHLAGTRRPVGDSLTDYVIKQSRAILLSQQQMFDLYHNEETREPGPNCHSWLGVPLVSQGEIIGVMVVQSYSPEIIYTEQDAEVLKFVSHHVSMAIKRREAIEFKEAAHEILEQKVEHRTIELKQEIEQRHLIEQQLKHSASHDALTGLPNRAFFLETLNNAIATRQGDTSRHFAVLFLDLDRFKTVNDSLGHHAGDQLLQNVASDLKSMVRESDMVARLGGDEFVVLINNIENNQEAADVANRMTDRLSQPYLIQNQHVQIGTSIGVLYGSSRYNNALIMLRDADTALYQAKDAGKGCFEIFDTSMHQKVSDALILESDMREGLERGEFIPYFQPIVELETNKIVGFEALARWHSDKRGIVYPDNFITQAEEAGIIGDIDLQILSKATQQIKHWQTKFDDESLYVSSNFDYSQFFDKSMPAFVASLLQRTELKPQCLILELTERGLLDDATLAQKNMQALKNIGVRLALDDFGTGYSSLSYLYRYPIDILKIDRSFIFNMENNPSNKAIIKTIVDLADNLNMKTIAEGIETVYEANSLKRLSSAYGQGYHFSRPVSAPDAEKLLKQQKISIKEELDRIFSSQSA